MYRQLQHESGEKPPAIVLRRICFRSKWADGFGKAALIRPLGTFPSFAWEKAKACEMIAPARAKRGRGLLWRRQFHQSLACWRAASAPPLDWRTGHQRLN